MTWKKTAINSHSKQELLEIISEVVQQHGCTFAVSEIYTNGTVGSAFAKATHQDEGGYIGGSSSPFPGVLAATLEIDFNGNFYTESEAVKAAKKIRADRGTEYAVFVSEENESDSTVTVCAVSGLRTYCKAIPVTDNKPHSESQVRYHAIQELARLMYNEVHQSIPVKQRKKTI